MLGRDGINVEALGGLTLEKVRHLLMSHTSTTVLSYADGAWRYVGWLPAVKSKQYFLSIP